MKFKVGDRVKCVNDGILRKPIVGKLGTIVVSGANGCDYGVEFDDYINGHSCGYSCKNGHGWYCNGNMLELVTKEKPIMIYRKGREVIAEDKDTGKTGVAKCNPSDEFDFYTGAKLALERLTGEKKEKIKFGTNMAIWCENKYQFDELMRILESVGYKWQNGTAATKYNPPACTKGVRIFLANENNIRYGSPDYKSDDFTYVDFPDVDFSECTQKIKVGDIVEIVDTGKMYPTHYEWVKEHVPDLAVYYAYGDSAGYHDKIKCVSGKFKVQHIADGKVYVMSNARGDRKCYLVGLEGLAKC